jgi:PAS domain S-box-containing protein
VRQGCKLCCEMGASQVAAAVMSVGTSRAVLDALPLAVVVLDPEARAVYANPLADWLLGDELELGRPVPWLADSRLGDRARAADNGVGGFEWGSANPTAAIVPSARGGTLRPITIALPGVEGLALVVFTAVSPADEPYLGRDPAEHLKELEAIGQFGSWSWDLEADVMTWSDEAYRLFGLAPQAAPTSYEEIRQRMHPDNRAESEDAVERCRRTGEGFTYTRRVVLPDGDVRWHQGRVEAVMAGGRVVRMFGIVQDVTERVRGEQALRDSLQRARVLAEENEALRAEIEAQLNEVNASRRRIVRAADYARWRLERDLHDGAQQRLTTVGLILRSAQAQLDARANPPLERTLEQAVAELQAGLSELRALARGLHPAILTDEGLVPALRSLASRSAVPAALRAPPLERLPGAIETAAYFVVAEALTNVTKHAAATRAWITVERDNGTLIIDVSDDGAGGAALDAGSGLRGLSDRVVALGGRLELHSTGRGGTRLRAALPCA